MMKRKIVALVTMAMVLSVGTQTLAAEDLEAKVQELEAQVITLEERVAYLEEILSAFGMMELTVDNTESSGDEISALPEGEYTELGDGEVYLACAGGTTEDGNVPVIYASDDTQLIQVGLNAWEFNGELLSFVYIDGNLMNKYQLSDSQTTLDLSSAQLTFGVHKVEVIQYEKDDETSDMLTYRTFSYEVKEG